MEVWDTDDMYMIINLFQPVVKYFLIGIGYFWVVDGDSQNWFGIIIIIIP